MPRVALTSLVSLFLVGCMAAQPLTTPSPTPWPTGLPSETPSPATPAPSAAPPTPSATATATATPSPVPICGPSFPAPAVPNQIIGGWLYDAAGAVLRRPATIEVVSTDPSVPYRTTVTTDDGRWQLQHVPLGAALTVTATVAGWPARVRRFQSGFGDTLGQFLPPRSPCDPRNHIDSVSFGGPTGGFDPDAPGFYLAPEAGGDPDRPWALPDAGDLPVVVPEPVPSLDAGTCLSDFGGSLTFEAGPLAADGTYQLWLAPADLQGRSPVRRGVLLGTAPGLARERLRLQVTLPDRPWLALGLRPDQVPALWLVHPPRANAQPVQALRLPDCPSSPGGTP